MRRPKTLLLVFVIIIACLIPAVSRAEESGKTVRVGWYESPFNITDQYGRRSGYAYEYQRKVAAYTNWNYEYVEGSWSELLQKLKNGEIDLLSDVSYVEARTNDMRYASLPMGTESYYVYVAPGNKEISSDNYFTLNGKRVGTTKGSVQTQQFREWQEAHGVTAEVVEMPGSEEDSLQRLMDGQIDAFVTLDAYGDPATAVPVWKIGSSDIYFAVNKNRPDLLGELDVAMNRMQEENKYYNERLYEKYLRAAGSNRYLSTEERKWLEDHGAIRVGYQDNYLAFCAKDEVTGELTGALNDCLAYASENTENAKLVFEPVAYPTTADALNALKRGDIDCVFPANLTDYDGEMLGVVMTSPLMSSVMDAVVREADQKDLMQKEQVTVAVNEGDTNYELFLMDNFPGWQAAYYPDTPAGLMAVATGEANCVIISNYRFSNISKLCDKLGLKTIPTGVEMDYYFAVREGETELYSILERVADMVPNTTVVASLTYYSTEDAKTSFADIIKNNLAIIMSIVAAVLLVIVLLLIRGIRAERKVAEEEHLIGDLNRRVYVDALTSVRNKGAFADYKQKLQDRVDSGEATEFAIGVFDCDDLKGINDQYGHDKGDLYIKAASQLICRIFKHSPVFRIGGDEFAVVLENEDYQDREDLLHEFRQAREDACAIAQYPWEEVRVALGIATYDSRVDESVQDTANRADQLMYEYKRKGKTARQQSST